MNLDERKIAYRVEKMMKSGKPFLFICEDGDELKLVAGGECPEEYSMNLAARVAIMPLDDEDAEKVSLIISGALNKL